MYRKEIFWPRCHHQIIPKITKWDFDGHDAEEFNQSYETLRGINLFSRLQLANEEETETPEVPQQGTDAPPPYTSVAADAGTKLFSRTRWHRLIKRFQVLM